MIAEVESTYKGKGPLLDSGLTIVSYLCRPLCPLLPPLPPPPYYTPCLVQDSLLRLLCQAN
jgi:hypothetical protein